ncbi:MAG: adenylate/guanylate cyclase domain-containing protein [candidate division WOR-3 bacterium]
MKNKFILAIFIALITIIVFHFFCINLLWVPFERRIYDFKYSLSISSQENKEIVIVDIDESSLTKLGRYQNWPRAYFAEVIDYLTNVRVLGLDIFFGEPDTLPDAAKKYYQKPDFDSLLTSAILRHKRVVVVSSYDKESIFSNIAQSGLGEIVADDDGVVRTCYPWLKEKETFASRIARSVSDEELQGKFLIYYLTSGSFKRIPFSDVYFKRVPQEYFSGKIVLIGGTAPGLFDYHTVPFKRHFPGIEIQANLVNNLINRLRIKELSAGLLILITIIPAFFISFFTLTKSTRFYIPFSIVCFFVYFLVSVILFYNRIQMGVIRGYYVFLGTIIISLVYRYQFEEKEKRRIKAIFSRYYSKELVERVVKEPPKLGGEKVFCTILFADIRNFTPYTEKSTPEDVAKSLNKFLTEMVMIVFKYQGRVDKFIGDCVMAVFGHPVALKNSALNACLCAREMVKKAGEMGFKIGVGINSGIVVSGNFGSPIRMEYTVIGDAVNLASRLEGLTKEFGVDIIVGEKAYQMVAQHPTIELYFKELGKVKVKGKEEETSIYELR